MVGFSRKDGGSSATMPVNMVDLLTEGFDRAVGQDSAGWWASVVLDTGLWVGHPDCGCNGGEEENG